MAAEAVWYVMDTDILFFNIYAAQHLMTQMHVSILLIVIIFALNFILDHFQRFNCMIDLQPYRCPYL